jgi:hypothetical protein
MLGRMVMASTSPNAPAAACAQVKEGRGAVSAVAVDMSMTVVASTGEDAPAALAQENDRQDVSCVKKRLTRYREAKKKAAGAMQKRKKSANTHMPKAAGTHTRAANIARQDI